MRGDVAWIFDLGADVYRWFTTQPAWQESCQGLAAALPPDDHLRIVDVGCGPGGSTIELGRARPGALVIGLDRAPRMLRVARRSSRQAQITWMRGDATRL